MALFDALLSSLWRTTLHLAWVKGNQYWVAEHFDERILVDHETYHRVLKEELAKRGIELKTWADYMKPAEEAWNRQWAIEKELRSSFDFWRRVQGVEIWRLHQNDRKE